MTTTRVAGRLTGWRAATHWALAPGVAWGPTPWRGWGLAAYVVAGVFAMLVGWTLFHVPFQVSDNVANMVQLQQSSLGTLLWSNFAGGTAYVRPFLWGALKLAFDASHGHHFPVFRGIQALQVLLLVWLFVRVLNVRTAAAFAVAPLGAVMLLGFPTFRGLVIEAFPINTYLTVALCALAALNLTISRPSWKTDVAAVLLFAFAVLTLENGIVIWPCLVAAFAVGLRGVSRRGLAGVTAALAAYLTARILFVVSAAPSLSERPSGFGFRLLEPQDLVARFGDNPLPFYVYNIVTAPMTVLFAEPRRGIFHFVQQALDGRFWPGTVLAVALVTATTVIMLCGTLRRARRWRTDGLAAADGMVLTFLAVLAANAVVSFPYQKDEIMSVAGVLYAVAATVALQTVTGWCVAAPRPVWLSAAVAVLLFAVGAGWSVRYVDLLHHLNLAAVRNQTDWVFVDRWKQSNSIDERYPEFGAFIDGLRREAVMMPVPSPVTARGWDRYSDSR